MTLLKSAALSLGALAAAWAGATALAGARAKAAESDNPPSGRFVDAGGHRIHYVETGEGPPVVLIHGAHGTLRDMTFDLAGRLAERYRVIAVDRPGLGWSGRSSGAEVFSAAGESPAEQAAVLAAAARALGVERPVVVGHSYGGAVALAWALDHDPAAVVSLAGVANPWPGGLGMLYQVNGTALGGALVAPFLSALVPGGYLASATESVFHPQTMPEGYAAHFGPYMPVRLASFRANARQVNTLYPHIVEMSARYDGLTLPIELVHGDADNSVPLSIHSGPLAERLENARLTVLPGVGHMPHHADPDAAVAAVDRAAERAGLR